MKKIFAIISVLALLSSCEMDKFQNSKTEETAEGTLSFKNFALSFDDEVNTKASSAASGNYTILIYNQDGEQHLKTTYSEVKAADNKISLPAGNYTLEARSMEEEVPTAEFEQPVYGARTDFSITAGATTTIEALTCTLLQCKVTIGYNDEFLASVTGDGVASVTVTAGYPLTYEMKYNGESSKPTYEQSAGYFAVNGGDNTTMEVTFKGSIEGKSQKMTKVFTGIKPKQWRQITFVKKVDEQGTATFDIEINAFVADAELNNEVVGMETIIGEDPAAPKGDGGITMVFDYEAGCDAEFTDLENIMIPDHAISLKLAATVPDGIKKFTVDIDSTSESFLLAVEAANARSLDLIHPAEGTGIIFQVVPFPHGEELLGQTSIQFDLSAAQEAIITYQGVHTFSMAITDSNGCKKVIPVKMIVE